MISKPNFTLGKRGSTWTLWGSAVIASRNKEDEICSLSFTGEGNGNPLQCSCLENPRDGGAWWAAIYGVAQSQTWLMWRRSSSKTLSNDLTEWEVSRWASADLVRQLKDIRVFFFFKIDLFIGAGFLLLCAGFWVFGQEVFLSILVRMFLDPSERNN